MKYFLAILSAVIVCTIAITAWNNPSASYSISIPFSNLTILLNSFVYISGVLFLGFTSGLLLGGAIAINQKEKINPYKRQLEKLSVVKDSNESRVKVLEAKIKTLETALQQSLKQE